MDLVESNNKNNRIYYLDILRVMACLAVIMIHTSMTYVIKDIGSVNFWLGNIFDSLARIGVPLFVMISGTLMLNEKYECKKTKLIGHIKKMIVFFIFWSAIYCIVFNIIGQIISKNEKIQVFNVIISFVQGYYHLWFIYLIIGLYLIVPLLRLWVKEKNKKYVEYFITLSIIFTYIIPQIINIGSNYNNVFEQLNDIIERKLCLRYVGRFTTYFILGWYINNYDIKKQKSVYALGILGLIISIVGTYILSTTTGRTIQMYENLSLNVLLQSVAVFLFVKTKWKNIQYKDNKFIKLVSKNSLGIYAIHVLVINIMYRILYRIGLDIAIINIPIVFIVSFIISFIISFIFSKIPILKKIV